MRNKVEHIHYRLISRRSAYQSVPSVLSCSLSDATTHIELPAVFHTPLMQFNDFELIRSSEGTLCYGRFVIHLSCNSSFMNYSDASKHIELRALFHTPLVLFNDFELIRTSEGTLCYGLFFKHLSCNSMNLN